MPGTKYDTGQYGKRSPGSALDDGIQYVGEVAEEGSAGIGELFGELFVHHGDARKRSLLKLLMLSFIIGGLIYLIIAVHHIDERQHRIEKHLAQSLEFAASLTAQNDAILANLLMVPCDTDTDVPVTVGCTLYGGGP